MQQLANDALKHLVSLMVSGGASSATPPGTGAEGANPAALPQLDGVAGMHLHVLGAVGDAAGPAENAGRAPRMTFEEGGGVVDGGTTNEPGRGGVVVSANLARSISGRSRIVVGAGGRYGVLCRLLGRAIPAEGIGTYVGTMRAGVAVAGQLGDELVDGRQRRRGSFRDLARNGKICTMGLG